MNENKNEQGLNRYKNVIVAQGLVPMIMVVILALTISVMIIFTIYRAYKLDKSYKIIHIITFVGIIAEFILASIATSSPNMIIDKILALIPFWVLLLFSAYRAFKLDKSQSFIHGVIIFISFWGAISYPFGAVAAITT
uniref:Uncharacterized protein n=1 Tax=viral metagenome TaxID=1070528 RepID=A0A6C0J8M7_9ZZZZ